MNALSRWFFIWCVIVSATDSARAQAPDQDVAAGEKGKQIVQFVKTAGQSIGFSGVVFAARDGKPVAACATGFADLDGKKPLTSTTLFEIASATKPFTAMAVCKIAEQGKLKLDDSISLYLPDVPVTCQSITVRHLLQHTSGISGHNTQGRGADIATVLPLFLKDGPQVKPGTRWEYWNQGYSLATEIAARASGKSYVEYCRTEIFKPAGMNSTCFTGDQGPPGALVAIGTSANRKPRSALDHPYGSYGFEYRGMGGMVTNVWDLWRCDRALKANRILNPETKAEMFKAGPGGYGLGWFTGVDKHQRSFQKHGGSVRGFVCELRRFPQDNACLFVLGNRDKSEMGHQFHYLVKAIEQILFDQKLTPALPLPLNENQRDELAGTFIDDRNRTLTIESEGLCMRARIDWGNKASRGFIGTDDNQKTVFFNGNSNTVLGLDQDAEGAVQSVSLLGGKLVFNRKK
ncbi:MAG: serine hydrolase [Gimesia sp.]|nr:serine hydrolase [Gimesia sp.]